MGRPPNSREDLWRHVDHHEDKGCWPFTGALRPNGYAAFLVNRKVYMAHRLAYELAKGPIPDGLVIDHLCRNRACCNPDHLEAVTQRENTLRGISPAANNSVKDACGKGHQFTEDNTYVHSDGSRQCRTCVRLATRAYYARLREQGIPRRRGKASV